MNRLRRRFGFDGNELRREVDRAQWMIGPLLLILLLGIAPMASAGVSDEAPRSHTRTITDAAGIGLGTILAMGLPMLLVYGLLRHRCDRRRAQLREAGWARLDARRIGP